MNYHVKNMNTSILISVLFLAAFVLNLIFGTGIISFWDLINGICLTLAITNLAPKILHYLEQKS